MEIESSPSFVEAEDTSRLAATLRSAVAELSSRGLYSATKWLSELLDSVPAPEDLQESALASTSGMGSFSSLREADTYMLAKSYFDCKEYKRAAMTLDKCASNPKCQWLRLYSLYLVAVKDEDQKARRGGNLDDTQQLEVEHPLMEILVQLKDTADPFLLYLKSLVLAKLGERLHAMNALVASLSVFPYNWSAWLKLSDLLDGETELLKTEPILPQSVMTKFFHIHATLEVHRALDDLRIDVDELTETFPNCLHLKSYLALIEYHLRDFDAAEQLLDEIASDHPYRMEDLDIYSNILYVVSNRAKLAQLAHRYFSVDRDRPESCILIGNFYSMRGDRPKAIAYFRRALRLDPGFLSAWTLMGHEYVESANTHAAIEAYRRACDANAKDYRAWYGLGQTYELLGMHVYSLRYYQKATALRPFDARMWQALAGAYQRLSKPHEVLKCYKRAQLVTEPDDISVLSKLGEQCFKMQLFPEASLYWGKLIDVAVACNYPLEDYVQVYNYLAAYEMGEHLVQHRQPRVIGDLQLAEIYLGRVLTTQGDDADRARALQRTLRTLQL